MDDEHSLRGTPDPEKQKMLQRMARRKGRKLKGRANSKKSIRTWAEYSGVNLEPTGSYSNYTRLFLVFIAFAMIPVFAFLLYLDGSSKSLSRKSEAISGLLGSALAGLVIFAAIAAAMVVIYTFLRAIIEANQR